MATKNQTSGTSEQEAPKESTAKAEETASTSEAPKEETSPKAEKTELAYPAPSQYKDLPKGRDGGPATIDNPPKEEDSK